MRCCVCRAQMGGVSMLEQQDAGGAGARCPPASRGLVRPGRQSTPLTHDRPPSSRWSSTKLATLQKPVASARTQASTYVRLSLAAAARRCCRRRGSGAARHQALGGGASSVAQPFDPDLLPGGLAIQLTVEAALRIDWEGAHARQKSENTPARTDPAPTAYSTLAAAAAGGGGGAPGGSYTAARRACS